MKKVFLIASLFFASNHAFAQTSSSYTNTTGSIVNLAGISANANSPLSVTNLSLTNPTLTGGNKTDLPADKPGSTGTAIPNTGWVDKFYLPRSFVMTQNITKTMCSSGCDFTSILDFNTWINSIDLIGDYQVYLNISAGTYPTSGSYSSSFDMHGPNWSKVQINGATAATTILNFNNLQNNNSPAFFAREGANLRFINHLTINGIGGRTGTHTWGTVSAGAAFSIQGNSGVHAGGDMILNDYYYDVLADVNGYFLGDAGLTGNRAGDVNFLARHGGTIHCEGCIANDAGDAPNGLGFNFLAEAGGHVWADGSTATGGLYGGFCASAGGTAWYHNVTATNGNVGIFAFLGGILFADGSTSKNNTTGVEATTNGKISGSNITVSNNSSHGFYLDRGYFEGTNITSSSNGGYGAFVVDASWGRFFSSKNNFTNNTSGASFVDVGATCSSTSTTDCHAQSSILLN